jgi:uncharacterized membrane protein (DUF485 family)
MSAQSIFLAQLQMRLHQADLLGFCAWEGSLALQPSIRNWPLSNTAISHAKVSRAESLHSLGCSRALENIFCHSQLRRRLVMLHEPAQEHGEDRAAPYKMRLGVIMFVIYAAIYVGFVAINTVKPTLMEKEIILGLNLAVVYGFALIVIALIMALIYNCMCSSKEKASESTGSDSLTGGDK